jgi:hypothetical protein
LTIAAVSALAACGKSAQAVNKEAKSAEIVPDFAPPVCRIVAFPAGFGRVLASSWLLHKVAADE